MLINSQDLQHRNIRALARAISIIENEVHGYEDLLRQLNPRASVGVIGITGPPGAGKSTLTDALIGQFTSDGKKVAVLCVDPSSPFNKSALLGDRIRMSQWYNNDQVFIRSFATRGSLGGLNPKIIEITDLLRASYFDYVIIETVGVGQSEVEIASLADVTVVVLVPEAGDEIQTMKSGLMEVADIFVINKADRPGAEEFFRNVRSLVSTSNSLASTPVIKTIASDNEGLHELAEAIRSELKNVLNADEKVSILTERAYQLIQKRRMRDILKHDLATNIAAEINQNFNLYRFIDKHYPAR